ncbi:DNA excision repair protein ERCC-1 [Bradysia coprophila]|uniref:DNA excision repair protein ERCC-1 n=1 Tax=Bradysia coprophila TaxID=38358 RepID=UPI00187D9260|nr:DNA excision repair protein ERCC-1 [Bradysia coprophila]
MDSFPNDSFDEALQDFDIPSEAKIAKLSQTSKTNEQSTASTTGSVTSESPSKKKVVSTASHAILVNPKQRGNPLLKSITNAVWEFEDIVPDYVVGRTACILFLSLKYHNLNPDYIHNRLKSLGKMFELRVLLVQVDTKDPHNALKHLTRICFLADLTLMLAWNAEEAGKMVETYKLFENRPPDLIMERTEQYPHQKLVGALSNIKPVNKSDAMTLLQTYGSLANLINSSEDRLSQCSGLGPRKAKKLYAAFNEPFLKK